MIAHVVRSAGASVVIVVNNLAYVVHESIVPSKRPDTEFEISNADLLKASPYGIDLHIVYPDGIALDVEDFQRRLLAAGVVSLSDLKQDPSVINRILLAMIRPLSAEIYRHIKVVMEDYTNV